jgi:glycosyltransferase involved in cell wall biosynthesis
MGSIDPARIPVFLKALDIFCFPSLWEGFGGALIEAMAAGLPIVASDIPPHREVVGDAGLFVSPGNADEISKTIQLLAGDISLREKLSDMSRERAKVFSLDNTIAAYEMLFEKNLKKAKLL